MIVNKTIVIINQYMQPRVTGSLLMNINAVLYSVGSSESCHQTLLLFGLSPTFIDGCCRCC